ncbi:hypothetical protein SAMN04488004_12938 [Loktanella salsilacus]|uniref:Uncharacterized protein n=1 Tax=Loktanella salsilacus TaxID=195913 RepID=A0A1I4IUA4_9RHOB|nr:hypothetical protein SAMN04488004_12938 [Loktanella salsilacus]
MVSNSLRPGRTNADTPTLPTHRGWVPKCATGQHGQISTPRRIPNGLKTNDFSSNFTCSVSQILAGYIIYWVSPYLAIIVKRASRQIQRGCCSHAH